MERCHPLLERLEDREHVGHVLDGPGEARHDLFEAAEHHPVADAVFCGFAAGDMWGHLRG